MRRILPYAACLFAMLVFVPAGGQMPAEATAQERAPLVKAPDCLRSSACCCWCPNDYLRKALPCVPPPVCGCGNDYCRKPLPCVPPPVCGCGNDYCRKPLVCVRPNCEPWYSCVPSCVPAGSQKAPPAAAK